MLTHLLFSISALIIMIIFIITYFSNKKNASSVRSKIYIYMIYTSLALTLVEIIEGITYVYDINIIFSLMWKLHSMLMVAFVSLLFYYFLATIKNNANFEDLFWNSKKLFSVNNIFSILFFIGMILSIVFVKTYPIGLTMFYFYTNQSFNNLLILYLIYIFYNFYIVYIKFQTNNLERNDNMILIGTFILFVIALVFEYFYSEISIYSTLFTLVLILIYYFKENEDLLMIEELQKTQANLNANNENKINYLHELIGDLENPINDFCLINKKLENCNVLSDEELQKELNSLNYISNNLVNLMNSSSSNRITKYRIDELINDIELSLSPSINQKQIKIVNNIDKSIPSLLLGDRLSVYRIIYNLFVNAIENTEIGKIVLTITGDKRKDIETLSIKVSDTGKGIKKEDYDKVFLYNENMKSDLALAKRYVDSLGGQIFFESSYGAGSIFYVKIDQTIASEEYLSQAPILANEIIPKDYKDKKVLIVDNKDFSTKKMVNILSKYNFTIECTKSGNDTMNLIKGGNEYDLIFINDNIKDVDIIELINLIRYLEKIVKIPPLVGIVQNDERYHQNGLFDEMILKPLSLKKLNEIIEKRCI